MVGYVVHDLAGLSHPGILNVSVFTSFLWSFLRLLYCPAWMVVAWHHSGNQVVHASLARVSKSCMSVCTYPLCFRYSVPQLWANLVSSSPETLFYCFQKIYLQSFARLGMGNCLAVPIWEIWWSGSETPFTQSSLFDPTHLTPTPRHSCCLWFPRILQVLYVDESVDVSHYSPIFFPQVYQTGCCLPVCFPASILLLLLFVQVSLSLCMHALKKSLNWYFLSFRRD